MTSWLVLFEHLELEQGLLVHLELMQGLVRVVVFVTCSVMTFGVGHFVIEAAVPDIALLLETAVPDMVLLLEEILPRSEEELVRRAGSLEVSLRKGAELDETAPSEEVEAPVPVGIEDV